MSIQKAKWSLLVFFGWSIVFFSSMDWVFPSYAANSSRIEYDVIETDRSTIHTIVIPHDSNYTVTPAASGKLQLIEDFTIPQKTVAAINGGYFDPVNHRTTSFIVENAQIVADPRFNARLMDNPDLQRYLSKILNRAEFRVYSCGDRLQYDIQLHSAPIPSYCTLTASLGGGPGLLPQDTSEQEAFTAYQNGEQIRNAIGSDSLNARSAVAITQTGDVILAMVAQQIQQPANSGISLTELADFLSSMGAVKAMNLDGGSSASLYYGGRVIYGKVDAQGDRIQRPIKSVLLVNQTR